MSKNKTRLDLDLLPFVDKLLEKHIALRDEYYSKRWDGLGLEENMKVHALRELRKEIKQDSGFRLGELPDLD